MDGPYLPEGNLHILALPHDLLHTILSQLEFEDKISAGLVCKQWDQQLKVCTAAGRHWEVELNIDSVVAREGLFTQKPSTDLSRWFSRRAAAIKTLHVSATLFRDPQGIASRNFFNQQLPLLAGCLSKYVSNVTLTFYGGSPFGDRLLSSSAFLPLLCPMLKSLILNELETPIRHNQFAAICKLSNLEELTLSTFGVGPEGGLQEMTSDISKLVNLKVLNLSWNTAVNYIPESISCLQRLEELRIEYCPIQTLPISFTTLANLTILLVTGCASLRFPLDLQGLKSLSTIKLGLSDPTTVPAQFAGLSALTLLDLSEGILEPQWWPTRLRLTQLMELNIFRCRIESVPAHVSALVSLKRLYAVDNRLRSLPDELSSLGNLEELVLTANHFCTVPISILAGMTALRVIRLDWQLKREERSNTFRVPSSLLPILHPGVVHVGLDQPAPWDPVSLFHLGRAALEVEERKPVPRLTY